MNSENLTRLDPVSSLWQMFLGEPAPTRIFVFYTRPPGGLVHSVLFDELQGIGHPAPVTLGHMVRELTRLCPTGFNIDRLLVAGAAIVPDPSLQQIRNKGFLRPSPFGAMLGRKLQDVQYPRNLSSASNDPDNQWWRMRQRRWILTPPISAIRHTSPDETIDPSVPSEGITVADGLTMAIMGELSPADVVRLAQVSKWWRTLAWEMPLKTFSSGWIMSVSVSQQLTAPYFGAWTIDTEERTESGIVGRISGKPDGPGPSTEQLEHWLNNWSQTKARFVIGTIVMLNPLLVGLATPGQAARSQAQLGHVKLNLIDDVNVDIRDSRDNMFLALPISNDNVEVHHPDPNWSSKRNLATRYSHI